jgi:serine/threonine protein kinase
MSFSSLGEGSLYPLSQVGSLQLDTELPGIANSNQLLRPDMTAGGVGNTRPPFRLQIGIRRLSRSPKDDFFHRPDDLYHDARIIKQESPKESFFTPIDDLQLQPQPKKTVCQRIYHFVMSWLPKRNRIGDETTIIRDGLSFRAQKLFDELPRFHDHFNDIHVRVIFAKQIDELLNMKVSTVFNIKRDKLNPNSKTISVFPNGAVLIKMGFLARGGNKKVYEALCILPNGKIIKTVEQRYIKRGGEIPTSPFSLVQEALLANQFDKSPKVVEGPIAYFTRANGNQSVVLPRYKTDFHTELRSLSLDNALIVLRDACLGVDEFHKRGLVHRDIKPENIFVETLSDGSHGARVADLGYLVSELRCSSTRSRILQEIELDFSTRTNLFGTLGKMNFPLLSHYMQDSGGLYPINIDPRIFRERGLDPLLVDFQEYVKQAVVGTIQRSYCVPKGLEPASYVSGSNLIFSFEGKSLFPLLSGYIDKNHKFPTPVEFLKFLKENIKRIIKLSYQQNRNVYNKAGVIVLEPLLVMISRNGLTSYPTQSDFERFFTSQYGYETIKRVKATPAYKETIGFLGQLDCVNLECETEGFMQQALAGNLSSVMAKYIDPVGFKATISFLHSLQKGLIELTIWEQGGPEKVTLPEGHSIDDYSELKDKFRLDLYPIALEFLTVVTERFLKKIGTAGTLQYMAPELIYSGIITTKADVYALGMILGCILGHFRDELSLRQPLKSELQSLFDQMTQVQYKRRPVATECIESLDRILSLMEIM